MLSLRIFSHLLAGTRSTRASSTILQSKSACTPSSLTGVTSQLWFTQRAFCSSSSNTSKNSNNKQSSTKQLRTFKKQTKTEESADPIVLEYVLQQIQTTQDPEKLDKISKILDAIEKREAERQKRSVGDINTHSDILTETDVYRAVQSLVDTPEEKLIKGLNGTLPIDVTLWKKNIKKRIQTIPTFQLLRLLKNVFGIEQRTQQNRFDEDEIEYEDEEEEDFGQGHKEEIGSDGQAQTKRKSNSGTNQTSEEQQHQQVEKMPAEIRGLCHSIWQSVESEFSRRLKFLSIDEIARTARLYAHANRSNAVFFREIENEIFERDMEYVNYTTIGVLLEAFSHANLGSATLYNNLAKTIKVAQAEIHPIQMAKYAYYFSKTPENIQGGFGVYQIAEKKLENVLEIMEFTDLVKLSKYFLAQNIGSNAFLKKVEEALVAQYPQKQYGGISPNLLTKLIKHTSKHYFQFNDQALFHILEADAIKQIPYMTVSQISSILWSYSRSRRGNNELYDTVEKAIIKKIALFNARTIAFIYYQFSFARKGSKELFERMEEKILSIGIDNFSGHYLVKILSGMNLRNALDSLQDTLLSPILTTMTKQSAECKYAEAIGLAYLLVELPPYKLETSMHQDDPSLSLQEEFDKLFAMLESNKFLPASDNLRIDEVSQLYFAYRTANLGSQTFLETLESRLARQSEIPKPYFARVFSSLVQHNKFDLALPFIPILKELMTYGDVKYFFSHEDFIRIVWSALLLEQAISNSNDGATDSQYMLPKSFWLEDAYQAMLAINPNSIKFTALPIWTQNICMLTELKMAQPYKKFEAAKKREAIFNKLIEKIDEIDEGSKGEYIKRDLSQFGSDIKHSIKQSLTDRVSSIQSSAVTSDENASSRKPVNARIESDLVDEFLNVIDCAAYIPLGGAEDDSESDIDPANQEYIKIGVVILNEHHYSSRSVSSDHSNLLMQTQNKIALLQNLLGWQIIVIDESQWKNLNQEERKAFFEEHIQTE